MRVNNTPSARARESLPGQGCLASIMSIMCPLPPLKRYNCVPPLAVSGRTRISPCAVPHIFRRRAVHHPTDLSTGVATTGRRVLAVGLGEGMRAYL